VGAFERFLIRLCPLPVNKTLTMANNKEVQEKRPHRRLPLDTWTQVHPESGNPFPGMSDHFSVFRENDILFFVAYELFHDALGLKNYYAKLHYVYPHHKRRLRLVHGRVPQVCVAEHGVQTMLYRTRTSVKKTQLVDYLNDNYNVHLRSKSLEKFVRRGRASEENLPCANCVEYARKCQEMALIVRRLRREVVRLRSEGTEGVGVSQGEVLPCDM